MEFQYDDDGSTSIVFALSVLLLYLLIATLGRLSSSSKKGDEEDAAALTSLCVEKEQKLKEREEKKKTVLNSIPWNDLIYICAWIAAIYFAWKVSQFETTEGYDPFKILGVSESATPKDIKSAYRQLSRLTHPDRNPDDPDAADKFMKIRKAYEALTDEETREKLEEFGNPDGRQELSFGIALPSWIVAKDNAMTILVVYTMIFMVLLPVGIGTWWYNRNYTFSEDALENTRVVFAYQFDPNGGTNVTAASLIQWLSWSAECQQMPGRERDRTYLEKLHNAIGYPTDDDKGRSLKLPKLETWKYFSPERFRLGWSMKYDRCAKARYLMHAYLTRAIDEITLSKELQEDMAFILRRIPTLIGSLVEIAIIQSRGHPPLRPTRTIMHLQQQFVQALPLAKGDPLLQVPWFDDLRIKNVRRAMKIRNVQDLFAVSAETRRKVLKGFSETELKDVEKFGSIFPMLSVSYRIKVGEGENESDKVTTNSMVTMVVEIKREAANTAKMSPEAEERLLLRLEKGEAAVTKVESAEDREAAALKILQSKKGKGRKTTKKKRPAAGSKTNVANKTSVGNDGDNDKADDASAEGSKSNSADDEAESTPAESSSLNSKEGDSQKDSKDSDDSDISEDEVDVDSDDDFDWEANDDAIRLERDRQKRQREQMMRPKDSHPVHCPRFPERKQEFWWVFLANDITERLVTPPRKVTNLKDSCEVDIMFQAPPLAGTFKFQIYVVSDSYIGQDKVAQVKLNVEKGEEAESQLTREGEVESEDSEQEFMLSDEESDEDDF